MERLSTRTKIGIKYNRQDISADLMEQTYEEVVKTLDEAIVLLISRQLITLERRKSDRIMMITVTGHAALDQFKEELANVD